MAHPSTPSLDVDVEFVAARRVRTWFRSFQMWGVLYYLLGLGAMAGSGAAAFFPDHAELQRMSAGVAFSCTLMLTFVNPGDSFLRFRRAWHLLDHARLQEKGPEYRDNLRQALDAGQAHINSGELSPLPRFTGNGN